MRQMRKIPKQKTRLGFFEKMYLSKKGVIDNKNIAINNGQGVETYYVSSFVISEVARFESLRDFIFENYRIILDCRNLDKIIVNCPNIKNRGKKRYRNCIGDFSETIAIINNMIDNIMTSLSFINADVINKRNNLLIKISQTKGTKKEHIKIMLRTQLEWGTD